MLMSLFERFDAYHGMDGSKNQSAARANNIEIQDKFSKSFVCPWLTFVVAVSYDMGNVKEKK